MQSMAHRRLSNLQEAHGECPTIFFFFFFTFVVNKVCCEGEEEAKKVRRSGVEVVCGEWNWSTECIYNSPVCVHPRCKLINLVYYISFIKY